MNQREAYQKTGAAFKEAGIGEWALEARFLLESVLGTKWPLSLEALSPDGERALADAVTRRLQGEPLQYILGEWAFMGLPFFVGPQALIPRQDTETLCEEAVRLVKERGYKSALDLCCGSGCIGVALQKLTGIKVAAADISPEALSLAKRNAQINGAAIAFLQGDLFAPVRERADLLVCNPPYLSAADMASLQKEVRFEPALALYGGEDGLDFYRRIAQSWEDYVNEGGCILLEIGALQDKQVLELFQGGRLIRDLNGLPRVIECEKL